MPAKKKSEKAKPKKKTASAKKAPAKKKVAKKKAPTGRKKVAPKRSKKKSNPTIAEGTYCFYLHGGSVLASLEELHDALLAMSDDQFTYHTDGRNDFAQWVDEVLGEAEVATALHRARMRKEAAKILSGWL